MSRKIGIVVAVIAIMAVAALVVLLHKTSDSPTSQPTATTSTEAEAGDEHTAHSNNANTGQSSVSVDSNTAVTVQIAIADFAFGPEKLTIKKGTTVTWTNNDSAPHTVTANGDTGPNSELLDKGKSYSYTFDTVGTFAYFCKPHPYMKGTVVVTD